MRRQTQETKTRAHTYPHAKRNNRAHRRNQPSKTKRNELNVLIQRMFARIEQTNKKSPTNEATKTNENQFRCFAECQSKKAIEKFENLFYVFVLFAPASFRQNGYFSQLCYGWLRTEQPQTAKWPNCVASLRAGTDTQLLRQRMRERARSNDE